MSTENIIELIRTGKHDKALDMLYENFPVFQKSFKKSGGKLADAKDVFSGCFAHPH